MATRTITFLPQVFQTDTNRKFLNATLDQLVTNPKFKKINGFIGRKTSPAFKSTDNYLPEPTTRKQNYQLEPSVVVDSSSEYFVANFADILDSINYHGGNITNQDRVFTDDNYTYAGLFDYDKFINYNQYYWLPNGPDSVDVTAAAISTSDNLSVSRNITDQAYNISDYFEQNPVLILARGGTYTFQVNQSGFPFYIQAQPGTSGGYTWQPSISTREVYGVENNGTDVGTVTFNVPYITAQNWQMELPNYTNVDYATDFTLADIANKPLSYVQKKLGGIDGVTDIANKTLVFVHGNTSDAAWQEPGIYEDYTENYDGGLGYDPGALITGNNRSGIFRITVDSNYAVPIVKIKQVDVVTDEYKIKILTGNKYAYREFYKGTDTNYLEILPPLTAPLDTLFYQDGSNSSMVGTIKLVDVQSNTPIDVELDILGKKTYTSVNNVVFTNGLKVRFDSTVKPVQYQNNEYYVEGVGDAIRLAKVLELVTIEDYIVPVVTSWDNLGWDTEGWEATIGGPTQLDYLTINRASIDQNAWSRSNRWFHTDVISATATYNNSTVILDQNARAKRPIIEFNYDLQLFNNGRVAKASVSILDTEITDAFSLIEGTTSYFADGVQMQDGDRVIFAGDTDPDVRNKIYVANIVDPSGDGSSIEHLTLTEDGEVSEYETVIVYYGDTNSGKTFWYDGSVWQESQQKTTINQTPLFDIFDDAGVSYSDSSKYPDSTFAGTKLFSYKVGTGTRDPYLDFAFTYKNLQNIGDITFENNFDLDSFEYTLDSETINYKINNGTLNSINSLTSVTSVTCWIKSNEDSKQYQLRQYLVTDATQTDYYLGYSGEPNLEVNNLLIYKNSTALTSTEYSIVRTKGKTYARINVALAVNDRIDIKIYSKFVLKDYYYQVPENLEINPANEQFTVLTLGQLRQHVRDVYEKSKETYGIYPGASNLRDTPLIKDVGGNILQHAGSMISAGLFLCHPEINFISALDLAAREYQKFKNKIVDRAITLPEINYTDIPGSLDAILSDINLVKNADFPWYYSDMLAYGIENLVASQEIIIEDDARAIYNLETIFSLDTLTRQSVLIYLNGEQLTYGQDYTFLTTRPAFSLTDTVLRSVDDVLLIKEYSTTNGSWIPETPTKLGMYPAFKPVKYLDETFVDPIYVIQGHDGSITPTFGDFRDDILLEFEKRVYNNIKAKFSLDKVSIFDVRPGKFRDNNYTLAEYNNIIGKSFGKWAGSHQVNYSETTGYSSNNSYTWNYKSMSNKLDDTLLQGSWRAIFEHHYDTTRPHTHPWEMLGFSDQPDWWEMRYGPAPYTSGNLVLWEDLKAGSIYSGPRAGVDLRFARPSLLDIIPTDDYGQLRQPVQIFVKNFDSKKTKISYAIGEVGPAEAAWRRSSEYPFALAKAMAITKPAKFFGHFLDNFNYVYDKDIEEFTYAGLKRRIQITDLKVNDADTQFISLTNYVRDFLADSGITPLTKLTHVYDTLGVKLSYNVSGFTGLDYIKILAEQASPNTTTNSVLIPDDNLNLHVKKSVPQSKVTYSAVIVERLGTGYKVHGYNLTDPYFTIIPSTANNNKTVINVLGTTATIYNDYDAVRVTIPYGTEFVNRQQVVDFLVGYQRHLLSQGILFDEIDSDLGLSRNFVLSAHEFILWSKQNWNTNTVIVLNPLSSRIRIKSDYKVVDTINSGKLGSGKVLDPNFNYLRNNQLSVVRIGNDFVVNAINDQTMALVEMNLVEYDHCLVFDNATIFNDTIYEPSTGNRQQRLKMVGHKTLDFDGSLYAPGFVYNSENVDTWMPGKDYKKFTIIEFKDAYYVASEDIPGTDIFDYNKWQLSTNQTIKSGLLPNFSTLASNLQTTYNTSDINLESDSDIYSKGLLGFRKRNYFEDLGLDDTSQVKFYQGFIKEKGTIKSVQALLGAEFDKFTTDIDLYESWALRVGEYGATDINQVIEVFVPEKPFAANPTYAEFLNDGDTEPNLNYWFKPTSTAEHKIKLLPNNYDKDIFLTTKNLLRLEKEIKTAGYLKTTDIDGTIFDIEAIALADKETFINSIGSGFKLWVAKKANNDWDVYRASQNKAVITKVTNALEGYVEFTTDIPHGLTLGDFVVVKNVSTNFNYIYKVYNVNSLTSFLVSIDTGLIDLTGFESQDATGVLFNLHTVRFSTIADWAEYTPAEGWTTDDIVAIDQWGTDYVDWAVWKKTDNYLLNDGITRPSATSTEKFGESVAFLDNGQVLLAGLSDSGTGKVVSYLNKSDNSSILADVSTNTDFYEYNESENISATNLDNFGKVISASNNAWFAVGAPESDTSSGYVFTYKRTNTIADGSSVRLEVQQAFTSGVLAASFGAALSISSDAKWLYVGQPNRIFGAVYAYRLVTGGTAATGTLIGDGSTSIKACPVSFNSAYQLQITDTTGKLYVYLKDYTISSTNIVFTSAPADGLVITVNALSEYYVYNDTMGDFVSFSGFGTSVSTTTDGAQVVIGAPSYDATATNNGIVYVYDRSINAELADSSTLTFQVLQGYTDSINPRVTVDGTEVTVSSFSTVASTSTTVVLAQAPALGSEVRIETNNFRLLKTITPADTEEGQAFGTSVLICPANCTIYASAPNQDNALVRNTGSVYRFTNLGRLYGVVTGTVTSPTVTAGHRIRINDYEVEFTGTSLTSVIDDINNALIPGITASNSSNKLKITCDTELVANKLRILPGNTGTALTDLGLDIFTNTQTIKNPNPYDNANFGKTLALKNTADVLFIGSDVANTIEITTFDDSTTSFDQTSIVFKDEIIQSGAVLVYEYIAEKVDNTDRPGFFIFSQYLEPGSMARYDQFGASIAAYGNNVVAGALGSDVFGANYGALFGFRNVSERSWATTSTAPAKVDIDIINEVTIYNYRTKLKVLTLDILDPAKGKILGLASQNIDYSSSFDPAVYGTRETKNQLWGSTQIGKIWWNTNTVRYLDYEQSDLGYRSVNWGRVFPGSSIDVYEWVESTVPPVDYIAAGYEGTPYSTDLNNAVVITKLDPVSLANYNLYYFWVKGKTNINPASIKTCSAATITDLITDPKNQGIGYAVLSGSNSFGLYNASNYLSGSDCVLHIDYDVVPNSQVVHTEFELLQEKNPASKLPAKIMNKAIDSWAGQDAYGNAVPDPTLDEYNNLGISVRPRQGMFRFPDAGLQELVSYLNRTFASLNLIEYFDIRKFDIGEPLPSKARGEYDISVDNDTELSYLVISDYTAGDKVLVLADSTKEGRWTVYTLTGGSWVLSDTQSWKLGLQYDLIDFIASTYNNTAKTTYTVNTKNDIEKLTLENNDTVFVQNNGNSRYEIRLYTVTDTSTTYEVVVQQNATIKIKSTLYTNRDNLAQEIRSLLGLVIGEVFTAGLRSYNNNLAFVMIRYLLKEQNNVDWLFKTSFIDVVHRFRKLEQNSVYQKDNQDFLLQYLDEAKPYHTKIREYLLNYTGLDEWNADVTDFDLPAYYDANTQSFRSPDGTEIGDDALLSSATQYSQWYANREYTITNVIIEDGGTGYVTAPTVTISNGAKAYALVSNGSVNEIIITRQGTGLTTTPTITLESDTGTGAKAYAQIGNDLLRHIKTTIKFDRVTYDTAVNIWAPSTTYTRGQYVAYDYRLYFVEPLDGSSLTFTSGTTFDSYNLVEVINQNLIARNTPATWAPYTNYVKNDYIINEGQTYRVVQSFTSDLQFTMGDNLVETADITFDDFGTANDRIWAYYNPTSGMPGRVLGQLQSGITYPGVIVTGENFSSLPNDYPTTMNPDDDTVIQSDFIDTELGTRPEDIIVDGSGFVDEYSSYAPEELIPGRMFDTLNMQIHTAPLSDYTLTTGAGPNTTLYLYTGDNTTTTFSFKVAGTFDDVLFVRTKNRGQQLANTNFTVNYATSEITFNSAPALNDIVYVLIQNNGGNYLLYDKTYTADGSTVDFRLPSEYALIQNALVFVNGEKATNYTGVNVAGAYVVRFNTPPAEDAFIHVYAYNAVGTAREIHQTVRTVSTSPVYPDDYTITLDRAIANWGPYHANIIVEVNGKRLRPSSTSYFVSDGSTLTYTPTYTADINGALVPSGDIEVYVAGQRRIETVDYNLSVIDNSTVRTVTFTSAVAAGTDIAISCVTNDEFIVIDNSTILINSSVPLLANSTVTVTTYSVHDAARIKTVNRSGLSLTSLTLISGYDYVPYDNATYENVSTTSVTSAKFSLEDTHSSIGYVLVYKNGIFQIPVADYVLTDDGTKIEFTNPELISNTDIITITEFTENVQRGLTSYRMFRDILNKVTFYRIGLEESTVLAQTLNLTDTEIYVADASVLPIPSAANNKPGRVFINGECIEYWDRDIVNNKLSRLFRGSYGTGAKTTHNVGSYVISAGFGQTVPVEYDTTSIVKWEPNKEFVATQYVLYAGTIYQANIDFTAGSSFSATNLTERAQYRDKIWYDIVAGGQIGPDGSTLEVLLTGDSLYNSNTAQVNFIRQVAGFIA